MRAFCAGSRGGDSECGAGNAEGIDEPGGGHLGTAVGAGGPGGGTMAGVGAPGGGGPDDARTAAQSNRGPADGHWVNVPFRRGGAFVQPGHSGGTEQQGRPGLGGVEARQEGERIVAGDTLASVWYSASDNSNRG